MADQKFRPNRRAVLAGLAAAGSGLVLPGRALADDPQRLAWRAAEASFGWPDPAGVSRSWSSKFTPVWSLAGAEPTPRAKPGRLDVAFQNDLPASAALVWRGLDGVPSVEPLLGQAGVAPGGRQALHLAVRHAGTMFCDLGLLGDGKAQPSRGVPLIVSDAEPVPVDRDEVMMIEEWRVRPDGIAIAPGNDPGDTQAFHTINGSFGSDLPAAPVRANTRLRLRLINAGPRNIVAFKFEGLDVRVMAIDSRPAEPFLARNGAVVLAPGARVDAFVDVTGPAGTKFPMRLHDGKQAHLINQLVISNEAPLRADPLPPAPPLSSNGLPPRLDQKTALRIELAFGDGQANWVTPTAFTAASPPAFTARTGRTVVLSLTNRAATTAVFHLHGHHFRLLDRLDDGWKPFWLDTIAIDAGQTQRVAFAAEHAGRWLIEAAETRWEAPRLVRWYGVT